MNKATQALAVLIVEDMDSDTQLLVRLLKKADYELVYEQVETAEQMRVALEKRTWDIIISDYSLPQFNGHAALMLLKETGLDIPFIMVSGTMGEETAVSMMKAGAQDYMMKDNLTRLIPAVARELEQAEMRWERRHTHEQLLLQSSALNAAGNAIVITDRQGIIEWVNPAFTVLTGYASEEAIGKNPRVLVKSGRHDQSFYKKMWDTILAGEVWRGEMINRRKDGSFYTEEETITPLKNVDGKISHFIAIKQDISARKQAEAALQKNEEKLREVFNVMEEGLSLNELIFDASGEIVDYRILEVNPAFEKISTLTREQAVGKKATEIYEMTSEYINAFWKTHLLDDHAIKTDFYVEQTEKWRHVSTSKPIQNKFTTVFFDITEQKNTEIALRESEERLRTIAENAPDIIVELDHRGNILYMSRVLPGYQMENVIGKNFCNWVEPEYHAVMMQCLERVFSEAIPQAYETCGLGINGEKQWYLSNISPVKVDGRVKNAVLISNDITERKRAEDARAASEAELRALVEQVPATVYTEAAETRETLYISPQLEKLTGCTPAEWIKDHNMWKKIIHPSDLAMVLAEDERTTLTLEPFHIDYRILTRDGRTRWIHDESVMIESQSETPLFWQGVMYDITERKQAEEFLRDSEERHRTILQTAIDGFWVSNMQGCLLEVNETYCRMSGYSAQELLTMRIADLEYVEKADDVIDHIHRIMLQGEDHFEALHKHKDGSIFHVEISVQYRPVDGGHLVAFLKDITERKQAEKLVFQHNEQLRLLYEASQQLNRTLDLKEIYQAICDFMSIVANNDVLFISAFDSETKLITCRACWMENKWLDVGTFPSILLEEEGKGTQSLVIHTGQSLLLNDYQAQLKTAQTTYYINDETNEVETEIPPEDNITRSALIVPLKIGNRVSGVIQVMSYSPNAYTENQLKLLEALALHIASAEQNALLYGQVQAELRDRKVAEEFLQMSEERYRELFNSMIDGFALHEIICDENGRAVDYRFLEINPAFERLTGLQSENLIGKTVLEVMPNTEFYWIEIYGNVALTGRSTFCENYSIELGRYFEVSIYCPRPGQFATIMVDITDRKQAEEALRESEEKYRLIAENTSDGIALFGPDNQIQYVSPSYLKQLGYSQVEELNRTAENIYSIFHPDDRDDVFSNIFEAIKLKESGLIYSYRVKHKAGHYIWREDNAKFNYDSSGNYSGAYVICRDITERMRAEKDIHQRVVELEMLYQSGLALSQLLNPKEVGQKILDLLEEKLNWHHTRIRLYHPQDDSLELLDFNQPGLKNEMERCEIVDRYHSLITRSSQGMSGWVIQHGQSVRSADVSNDPRYVEAYPGIHSGLYVPMKLGERIVGVISIEDEQPDAFNEADERLIVTLANQAASAFENARLFAETRQRVMELETLNRISLILRAVTKQNEMLSIVLDEALAILNTSHGSIELHNKTTDTLDQVILRGWIAKLTEPHPISDGIAGKVFTSGETYITREFISDPLTRAVTRGQIPTGWGGICLPIRTTQQTLGVMIVSMPSERELTRDEIRLLSTLSEMTGAALQRMQLHEQTVRRLEQLHALRAIDQAIVSNLDMSLTLDILIDQTISQLGVDAVAVLLLPPNLNLLELAAERGFYKRLLRSPRLNESFAVQAIMEHRMISAHDFEVASKNPHFAKLWKEEGFACYWCVPLIVKGEVKGVMEVYFRKSFTPDHEWLDFLEALADQAAITIDTAQLFENLQRANLDLGFAYEATIEGWSRAMDLRDHETEGHTLRVTDLTVKLAHAMRIGEAQLTAIRRGALLHDIGKMGIPDAILLKEGALTDEEWVVMREHPKLARDMLLPITYLNDALDIPYCHHEKWDGTGYPQGLKGDGIPLVARIFAIVDVWDALTNNRTYRKKWTKQKARQYIKEQSGKHFDPQVVDAFLKSIGKG